MWTSLNLYDAKTSCFLQKSADGSLAIVSKKNASSFTPPRLISTATEIHEFLAAHKLPQMSDWNDSLTLSTPTAKTTTKAFSSAEFLKSQEKRLLCDDFIVPGLDLQSELDRLTSASTSENSSTAFDGKPVFVTSFEVEDNQKSINPDDSASRNSRGTKSALSAGSNANENSSKRAR